MCQINLSKLWLIKTIINWLRIIKHLPIFAFVTVHTRYCFLFKSIQLLKSPRFVRFIELPLVRWINWWNERGLEGLADLQKNGRPPILTLEEQEKAFALAMKNPKFPHRQLSAIKRETGKEISRSMLKNLIKKRIIFGKGSS